MNVGRSGCSISHVIICFPLPSNIEILQKEKENVVYSLGPRSVGWVKHAQWRFAESAGGTPCMQLAAALDFSFSSSFLFLPAFTDNVTGVGAY